ncbi:MAG TPA: DUF1236 domain-containing protein [Rhizomicrobium sp.]|jgi:hypothetical protein
MRSTLLAATAAAALLAAGTTYAQNSQPAGDYGAVKPDKTKAHEGDAQTGTTVEQKSAPGDRRGAGGMENTSNERSGAEMNAQPAAVPSAASRLRTETTRDTDNDHDRLRTHTTNVNITTTQRTRIKEVVRLRSGPRLDRVTFRIGVGERIPRNVTVAVLPPEIVEIVPQWSGFSYFVYGDEIVIIDPLSFAIVGVLPL